MQKFLYTQSKGIFILTFQNTGITQVVSHKNISIGVILLNLENRFKKKKKKIGSEKDDAILSYNQAFDLLPTFSSEEKANKNKT